MPTITNARAIKFSNERIRPLADRLGGLYYDLLRVRDELRAEPTLLDLLSSGKDLLEDGSDKDGRPPVTAEQLKAIWTLADVMIADFEADDSARLKAILSVAVNPR